MKRRKYFTGSLYELHIVNSLDFFSLGSNGCSDQLCIYSLDLRNFLDDFWDCLFSCGEIVVDWVANEKDSLDVLKTLQFRQLLPDLDLVVAHQKCVESNAWLQVQFLDIVVRNPEFFEGLTNVFKTLEPSDLIAPKRKNFEVLKSWKGNHLVNSVG